MFLPIFTTNLYSKFILQFCLILFFIIPVNAQLIDSFSDGNFTTSPVWSSDSSANWTVATSSDVSSGATNSNSLRLNAVFGISDIQSISTQIASMASSNGQSWSFWLGRRNQEYSTSNKIDIWLYANEGNLESSTVDGYSIKIGNNSTDDDIKLNKVTNNSGTTIITGTSKIPITLVDIGLMIRVTRTNEGVWTLYTSTLPTANGSGAIATDLPSSTNVAILQGTATDNTHSISDNGYFGIVATHSTGVDARVCVELDQIFFDLNSTAVLPVELKTFTARAQNNNVLLNWSTATESSNSGFEIERSTLINRQTQNNRFSQVGFVRGSGTITSQQNYSYRDTKVNSGKYEYRLKQIDLDGTIEYSRGVEVSVGIIKTRLTSNPNPFNNETIINYQLTENSKITIKIYDLLGKEIETLVNKEKEEGEHQIRFNSTEYNLTSGVYFCILKTNRETITQKLVLMK